MNEEFEILEEEVEFDQDLYEININENEFSELEDGIGSDDVKGDEE